MKNILIAIILFVCASSIGAQTLKAKADRAFTNLEYTEAIGLYTKYLEKNGDDAEARIRLAQCYQNTNQFYEAETKFTALRDLFTKFPNLQLEYANILLSNGKVSDAKEQVTTYLKINQDDTKALNLLKSCNELSSFYASEKRFNVRSAPFNSEVSSFSPAYYKDGIVYTSEQGGKKDLWTGRSYTNLFFTMEGQSPVIISGNLGGKYHNGTACFPDETHMIFTRNSQSKSNNDEYNLLMAEATLENGIWEFTRNFKYNNEQYNVAYPTVSPDGQYLIFSSDMPGGVGEMDLYMCARQGNDWAAPVNITAMNTVGDEVFPFCDNTGKLWFSSDGRPGIGGLDIFSADMKGTSFSNIQNAGAPINSSRDDFGLITKDGMRNGYLSSNRNNDTGIDNIYIFNKNKATIAINGIVVDEWTKMPLKETEVTLANTSTGEKTTFFTGEDGRFVYEGVSETNYELIGVKNQIFTTKQVFSTVGKTEKDKLYYTLIHNDPRFSLEGYAINVKDEKGVEGVNIKLFNKTNIAHGDQVSDKEGFFKFQLDQNSDFEVSGEKNGFYTSISEATTKGLNRSTTLYVKLILSIEEVVIGETKILGKETFGGWEFENIYYDLDKFNIRPDAAVALDKVVDFLNANSTLRIELGAHTDSRASTSYNQTLSQNRAEAAVEYIILHGIDRSRITAKGYGETRLVNTCADGVTCNEEQHQANRRTEIKVVGY